MIISHRGCICGLFIGFAWIGVANADAQIAWRVPEEAAVAQSRGEAIDALYEASAQVDSRHVVLQFDGPVSPALRDRLAEAGVTLQSYLGNHGYFAKLDFSSVNMAVLEGAGSLTGLRVIQRELKLHPTLAAGEEPAWAAYDYRRLGQDDTQRWITAYVLFHSDVSTATAQAVVAAEGGETIGSFSAVNGAMTRVPLAAVGSLADHDEVMYIEPALPALGPVNAENRALTGANIVQAAPYGLSGDAVSVMVYDGGVVRSTHFDFADRVTVLDDNLIGIHATHVAGTIGGSGLASGGFDAGMAPAVEILSYSFDYPTPPQGLTLVTDPLDLEADVADAMSLGADIMNASLASNIAPSGLDCALEGDYTVVSTIVDSIVRGAYGRPLLSVWGCGNERSSGACGVSFGTVPPPHAGKNHIVVGAVNANDDSMTDFSSWGPVDDGRIKPDFVAPGCQVGGDNGVTSVSGFDDIGYVTICGTSMAAPTVTGLAALMIEDFQAQYPDRPLFRNSTLKAILAHTAVDGGNVGPDYKFGYGSVRVNEAIDLMRSGAFWEGNLGHGESFVRNVTIMPGDPELKATLSWDDYPGVPNVVPSLVNDLDLVVMSPTNVRHYPWTLDPGNPNVAAVRNQVDRLNNIEQVLVNNPEAGVWTITVEGYNVPEGPQPFALIGDGASQSGITIDLPAGPLTSLPPGIPQPVSVQIVAAGESIVPASPLLHYRYDGGAFLSTALSPVGEGLYTATLPEASCGDVLEYYVSAEGSVSGVVTLPASAPSDVLIAQVGAVVEVFADDFESDQGWTASVAGATDGPWERGVPVPRTALAFGPQFDADGSGQCFVTDNAIGLSDVDNGSVILTSPAIDLSGPVAEFSFSYYLYTNSFATGDDRITAEVSTSGSGGPWVELFRYRYPTGQASDTVWHTAKVTSDMILAAGLSPSADTRIRFIAHDGGTASTVEAAVDAVTARAFRCIDPTCDDAVLNQGEDRIDCGGPCAACECTSNALCDNGTFCDGEETCDAFGVCSAGASSCTAGEWCSETAASCVAHGDGDFDGDLDVDLLDFNEFQICLGESAETQSMCAAGNLTGVDGSIDLDDFAMFASELESSGPQ